MPEPPNRGTVWIRFATPLKIGFPAPRRLLTIFSVMSPNDGLPVAPQSFQNELNGPLAAASEELSFTYEWATPDILDVKFADGQTIYPSTVRELEEVLTRKLTAANYRVIVV